MAKKLNMLLVPLKPPDSKTEQILEELLKYKQAGGKWDDQVKKINATGAALRRSLMGFDQLNRLARKSGKTTTETPSLKEALFDKEKAAELTGAAREFVLEYHRIKESLEGIGTVSNNVRVNFSDLNYQTLATANGFSALVKSGAELHTPMVQISGSTNIFAESLKKVVTNLADTAPAARQGTEGIKTTFGTVPSWFKQNVSVPIQSQNASLFAGMSPAALQAWTDTKGVFRDADGYFTDTFRNAWAGVMDVFSNKGDVFNNLSTGVLSGFKNIVNGMIGGINQVVAEPFNGVNEVFQRLRDFSLDGRMLFKNLNFSINMPRIPFLAEGAVLPANNPFLAVVGDQKHGTNIEAPLSTIQEAVALVMNEQTEAQLAGHSATVAVLREILAAVLGISLDEGAIARAVERHRAGMAVVTGGF